MINRYISDKITQNLPFLPTSQQESLIESLSLFLVNRTNNDLFLLTGYAGTGKTSILGAMVKTLTQIPIKTVLLAPTGRAAKVFGGYAEHVAFTIHKKIYRQQSFATQLEKFSLADNLHKDTIFIVDEASMIGNFSYQEGDFLMGRLLEDLLEYVYSGENCNLILVGDTAQLPPVGQNQSDALDKEVLRRLNFDVTAIELSQVVRQSQESGILFNATKLRQEMALTPLPSPRLKVTGFKDVIALTGEYLIEEISSAYNRNGIENCIIVTRSNKRANLFNQGVRNQILYREEELSSGDLLVIGKNNYFWSAAYKEIDFIANGDIAKVIKVRGTQEMYGFRFADTTLYLPDYEVEIDCKLLLDTLTSESPALSMEQNNALFRAVVEDYSHLHTKAEIMRKVKCDPYFNALQIKYGYAVTCHKAQGGEWKSLFLDMGYINPEHLGMGFYRWLYTAITRATEQLYLVNIGDEYKEEIADE